MKVMVLVQSLRSAAWAGGKAYQRNDDAEAAKCIEQSDETIEKVRALLSAQGCELATAATKQQREKIQILFTWAGVSSSRTSVNSSAAPQIDQDFRMRPASSEAAPSADAKEPQ
jgi:hypothetical protein